MEDDVTICACCETPVGPLVAGPLPGLRVCGVRGKATEEAILQAVGKCLLRRIALDNKRYPVVRV